MTVPLYRAITQALVARENCIEGGNSLCGNTTWLSRWNALLKTYDSMLPSGSGFDHGSKVDWFASKVPDGKLVIKTSFHHMNDGGFYVGWTEHSVTVKPSLLTGIVIVVGGRNRRDIKDYILEVFTEALLAEVDEQVVMNKVINVEEQKAKSA